MKIENLDINATLDNAAMEDTFGGGSWKLRRRIYKKHGIKKVFTKWKCGVKYRKVVFIRYC